MRPSQRPTPGPTCIGTELYPRTVLVWTRSIRLSSTSHVGKRSQRLPERDRPFEAGQRGADAEVRAVAEREVAVDVASHVEAVGILEVPLVAVGASR